MNITLSADKDLIDRTRQYAQKHKTTLNNLVRDYLKRVTNETEIEEIAQEFEQLARIGGGISPDNYRFNRDEIYNRAQ